VGRERRDTRSAGTTAGSRTNPAPPPPYSFSPSVSLSIFYTHFQGATDTVLDLDAAAGYRPKTRETREAFEALLGLVARQFGDQPADVLHGAADEVLATLKADGVKDPDKQREVEGLLGPLAPERFAQLVALGKLITDWAPVGGGGAAGGVGAPGGGDGGDGGLDEEIGVAVEFEGDESDEGGDSGIDEVVEPDRDEDGEDEAGPLPGAVRGAPAPSTAAPADADAAAAAAFGGVHPQDIDAHWLQRAVAVSYGAALDEAGAQDLAGRALAALEAAGSGPAAEDALVRLFDFGHFPLVKTLVAARHAIVWCMRRARAAGEAGRAGVEAEMAAAGPEAAAALAALRATRLTARQRQDAAEARIRAEAAGITVATGDVQATDAAAAPGGLHEVDLDSLAFAGGAHTMTNTRCDLPPGSFRSAFKGYEEVHIPAAAAPPFADGEALRPVADLPPWARPAFAGMPSLNRIQSRVCDAALFGSDNLLLCAPTGAGKTNVAMLTILHQIGLARRGSGGDGDDPIGPIDTSSFKCVYVAPMKALVSEMVGNFTKRLAPYGLTVRELTGDASLTRAEIAAAQIIVTTPEKWDIITRKAGGERAAPHTANLRLMIIDEVHLLHDGRGPVLEALVSRTLRGVEAGGEHVRLVGLSATLPNYEDVASFLRVDPAKGLFFFDNAYRPCPLASQYIGVSVRKPLQRLALMNEICYGKVAGAAGKHQVLVFVHSRKETAKTARYLRDEAVRDGGVAAALVKPGGASAEILQTEAGAAKDGALADLLPYGIAIHHAGMSRADRTLVEDLFSDGHVSVLVSTATLAWGVNLPAHTVIIKGTQVYSPEQGGWTELSPLDVMQMFGRAGRPQYDSFGEGIIITGHAELQYYLSLLNQQLPIESQMGSRLADALNAEVALGTVSSIDDAVAWLGCTYLHVRMLCAPALYGVPPSDLDTDPSLRSRRADLAHSAAAVLDRAGLVRYDRRSAAISPTDLGRIASCYYVGHASIATYAAHLRPTMGDIELLRLFALSDEFSNLVVRQEEKAELAKLLDRVPIPVKEGLDDPAAKVNVLLQAYIARLRLDGLALASDMQYVKDSAGRLARCLFELALRRGWAGVAGRALELAKCVGRRQWGCQSPLRQFPGVLPDVLARVERKDLAWDRYYDLTAAELGELVRAPKLGKTLHRLVHTFPRIELAAHVQPITRGLLKVDLTLTPDFAWDARAHGGGLAFWVLVEDADGEALLHAEPWLLRAAYAEDDHALSFTVPVTDPLPPQYFIRVVSDTWLGCESVLPVSFRHLILPAKFLPPTEVLDLAPLPVSALRLDPPAAAALFPGWTHFNPVQTQAFASLANSDDNVLVCAPSGAGKTACAEFALLRGVRRAAAGEGPPVKCVWVAPNEAAAALCAADWGARLPAALGLSVGVLTGDAGSDLKTLDRCGVVVATPDRYDALTRRWKARKGVQALTLVIADDLHTLGAGGAGAASGAGPALEVGLSRMRYMSATTGKAVRLVGLAACVANAADLGEWLGAPPRALFAFPPGARPVPLSVHIQGFDIGSMDARARAMARPAYAAVVRTCGPGGDPAIVFVPSRRAARLAALDLLTAAAGEGAAGRFLLGAPSDVDRVLAARSVSDPALKHALYHGVGYCYEGQPPSERAAVDALFGAGALQVLVCSAGAAWTLSSSAKLVIIAGTQAHEAAGSVGAADYPVADLLHMVGRAGRQGVDDRGSAAPGAPAGAALLLLCHAPRKAFLRKFLFEALPVESHLDTALHDHLASEVVSRVVASPQDAVDWLTWTFLYRRLPSNPNYYGLAGVSHRHLSDHLSDLVEGTLADLAAAGVVAVEGPGEAAAAAAAEGGGAAGEPPSAAPVVPAAGGGSVEPLNLGMVASYYYISYATVELAARSLAPKTKLRGLVDILAAAAEFDGLPPRPGEDEAVRRLLAHAPLPAPSDKWADPHVKAHALLQAHLSRTPLSGGLAADRDGVVVPKALRLLHAAVDVAASSGWLAPALAAMEASQLVVQGVWAKDSPLLQLPGVTAEAAAAAAGAGVESVFDLLEAEEGSPGRAALLAGLPAAEAAELAAAANRYPDISLAYALDPAPPAGGGGADGGGPPAEVAEGDTVTVSVELEREGLPPGASDAGPVIAPRFPGRKDEGWWLVVGQPASNALLAVKRVPGAARARAQAKLQFTAPAPGGGPIVLFFMCDAYAGCDQEYELEVEVVGGGGKGGGGEEVMEEG